MSRLLIATGTSIILARESDGNLLAEQTLAAPSRCLTVDPNNGRVVYTGTLKQGVYRSSDGGETWGRTALNEGDVYSVAVSAADGAVYAGTEPSRLYRSRDGGHEWEELVALQDIPSKPQWSFPPRPWTHHVRWIAPDPHDADRLLVGIEVGGVMLSEDAGKSFSDHRPGAQKDCHVLAWHPVIEGKVFEAGGGGAAYSADGGRTWHSADDGMNHRYCYALSVHPQRDEWYIASNPGARRAHYEGPAQAKIYRWRDEGPWEPLMNGLGETLDSMPYALVATQDELLAGLRDGRILRMQHGKPWERVAIDGDAIDSILAIQLI